MISAHLPGFAGEGAGLAVTPGAAGPALHHFTSAGESPRWAALPQQCGAFLPQARTGGVGRLASNTRRQRAVGSCRNLGGIAGVTNKQTAPTNSIHRKVDGRGGVEGHAENLEKYGLGSGAERGGLSTLASRYQARPASDNSPLSRLPSGWASRGGSSLAGYVAAPFCSTSTGKKGKMP